MIHSLPFAILPQGGQNHENLVHQLKLCLDLEPKVHPKARPSHEQSPFPTESTSKKNESKSKIGETSPHPVCAQINPSMEAVALSRLGF